ncbi:YcjF family protein [Pseudochelatococcus contaminans]|uniref:Putative membrane protein n=1 Tax=Pseudochelatococcus contaminans TaxID=1538103 RepID=A0A7W5Z421_9HYPH|nr:TIGR01620 family protein [Pseudochelatococcus contaminans]MBB3809756.1 putative membrane protein [Pseudochelatococcus contaminans]
MSRAPRAFRLDPSGELPPVEETPRETRIDPETILVEEPDTPYDELPPPAAPRKARAPWLGLLISALGGLVLLWIGLGVEQMISRLLATAPALGWGALALAGLALIALIAIVAREVRGILRERRIETLHRKAIAAREADDDKAAAAVVESLLSIYATRPETARARATLNAIGPDTIIDAADRLNVAEQELLAPLDRSARAIVANSAKQVSLVTAVSPRAIVDVVFVIYASARMVRRVAALYGGRPGLFGFLRLSGNVLSHLAVTGGIAVGDDIIQQVLGLGLAARLSAKLGEGVLNGLLTARVGLAAIEVCRPLPFVAVEPPRFTDIAAGLFDSSKKVASDGQPSA